MNNYIMIEGTRIELSKDTVEEMKTKFGINWRPTKKVIESIKNVLDSMSDVRVSYTQEEAKSLEFLLYAKAWIDEFDSSTDYKGKYKLKLRRDVGHRELLISQEQSRAGLFDAYFSNKDAVRKCIRWMKSFGLIDDSITVRD